MNKMITLEMLNLSDYDPEVDVIVVRVNIGQLPMNKAQDYVNNIKKNIGPLLDARGFDVIFTPHRSEDTKGESDISFQLPEPRLSSSDESNRKELFSYDDMLSAYNTGKEYGQKYGTVDPQNNAPSFTSFIDKLSHHTSRK